MVTNYPTKTVVCTYCILGPVGSALYPKGGSVRITPVEYVELSLDDDGDLLIDGEPSELPDQSANLSKHLDMLRARMRKDA